VSAIPNMFFRDTVVAGHVMQCTWPRSSGWSWHKSVKW